MTSEISVASVCERDIDLLLLEEFAASNEFLNWFLNNIGHEQAEMMDLRSAKRSVTTSSGESDLEIEYRTPEGGRCRLLIENKIAALFQPRQVERYQERASEYLERRECESVITVLIGPRVYFGDADSLKGFDHSMTYEDLIKWFQSRKPSGNRANYKLSLLSAAIKKATLGYQPDIDEVASLWWHRYWELTQDIAPELEMKEPGVKTSGSGFIFFHPGPLPDGVVIVHKFPLGCVDLQFSGFGKRTNELVHAFKDILQPDMEITNAARSGVIRLRSPILRSTQDFDNQRSDIEQGIRAAERLLNWFCQNIVRWSQLGVNDSTQIRDD